MAFARREEGSRLMDNLETRLKNLSDPLGCYLPKHSITKIFSYHYSLVTNNKY